MLCERCGKNEATMRLTKIINNKKTVTNLCAECARETGNQIPTPLEGIGSMLSGLLGLENLWKSNPMLKTEEPKRCPVCGTTKEDITREGKLGCGECYITFIDEMRPLLRKIHGNCLHHGSVPGIEAEPETKKSVKLPKKLKEELSEEDKLREQMNEAIAKEDFETAIVLRNKINELQQKEGE